MDISFHSSKNIPGNGKAWCGRRQTYRITAFHPTLSTEVKFSLQPYLARRVLAIADSRATAEWSAINKEDQQKAT
jgi:hypothetical protein